MQLNTREAPSQLEEAKKSILFTTVRPEIIMEKGQGMYLWDTQGKEYLDFIGGWAVTCLGHCPEVMEKTLSQQAQRLINASPAFYNDQMLQFAKLLTDNSCLDRVFFASSGAEANESAIKLARKYGSLHLNGAYEIVTTFNSFHGRTLATMSATGKKVWDKVFEPKVPGFPRIALNDLSALQGAINENTCAIMLEPIQGEGGVHAADQEFIQQIRKICDEKKILLIFDEIQTGIGRTGKLFAYEHFNVEPDIMTLGKGIAGGYPLSAMLCKERLNIFEIGDQGGTYSAQPLGMAVGYAVVNEIIQHRIFENAEIQGQYILKRLKELESKYGLKDIRGWGLLIAFDLSVDKANEVMQKCLEVGLLINSPQPSTIRLMPPLIVNKADIDQMLTLLVAVLDSVLTGESTT